MVKIPTRTTHRLSYRSSKSEPSKLSKISNRGENGSQSLCFAGRRVTRTQILQRYEFDHGAGSIQSTIAWSHDMRNMVFQEEARLIHDIAAEILEYNRIYLHVHTSLPDKAATATTAGRAGILLQTQILPSLCCEILGGVWWVSKSRPGRVEDTKISPITRVNASQYLGIRVVSCMKSLVFV